MGYKILGYTVWKVGKLVLKRKLTGALPSKEVGAGAFVAVLVAGVAVALWRREAAGE